jgi:hypothetical protein
VDFSRQFIYDNEDIVRDLKHDVESRLRSYWDALTWFFGELFQARLPSDWREQWHAVVAEQARRGYITDPQSVRDVEAYIAAWAKFCGLEPKEEGSNTAYTITFVHHDEGDDVAPPQSAAKPLSPSWPRLTDKQRELAQALTGLPSWFPLQPGNRMDGMWQLRFERLAQAARAKLLACYTEIAALGRVVREIDAAMSGDFDRLAAQHRSVQQSYDAYLQARIAIELEWASYLGTETWVGPEVSALVEKINTALPVRIDEFKSPLDVGMNAAHKAVKQATDAALARAERRYAIAVWTDRAVSLLQLVAAGVSFGKVAATIFKQVAKESGKKAALKAATIYVVSQLASAAVSIGVSAVVIPEILEAAGLDPVEVQIGMAAYGAIGVVSMAATSSASRGLARGNSGQQGRDILPPFKESRGVWDLGPVIRGKKIHNRLGENLPETFPTVDIFENGIVTSIKSVDLQAPTYDNPATLTSTLQSYVDKVANFRGGRRADTTILESQIKGRALDVAIPPGNHTSGQVDALRSVEQYGHAKSVRVRFLEIE